MATTTEQQPVTTTERVFVSAAAFMGKIQGIPYISQGLQELGASPTAIVYSNGPCCSCRCVFPCHFNCDCGDNYTYNTLVINNGETKYLYKITLIIAPRLHYLMWAHSLAHIVQNANHA